MKLESYRLHDLPAALPADVLKRLGAVEVGPSVLIGTTARRCRGAADY